MPANGMMVAANGRFLSSPPPSSYSMQVQVLLGIWFGICVYVVSSSPSLCWRQVLCHTRNGEGSRPGGASHLLTQATDKTGSRHRPKTLLPTGMPSSALHRAPPPIGLAAEVLKAILSSASDTSQNCIPHILYLPYRGDISVLVIKEAKGR